MYPFLPEEAIGPLNGCVALTIVNPLPQKNADTLNRADERGVQGVPLVPGPECLGGP